VRVAFLLGRTRANHSLYPWIRPAATLLKPYTLDEMLETVKQVLREADRAVVAA
jgi:hypothetical protein